MQDAPFDPSTTGEPAAAAPADGLLAQTPRPLLRGTRVQRFEIVRVLAERSAAIVYLAIDHERQAEVALKEYMPQRLARRDGHRLAPLRPPDAEPLARGLQAFIAEARLLAQASHPSLVRMLALIEAHGTAYQVMPRYLGTTLLQLRQEMVAPPDEPALQALLDGLLGALDALHRNGQMHGDVAPGNILLLADDRPLLLGPGRARDEVASTLVESLMAAVAPSFAAPEQRSGAADAAHAPNAALGAWTDLYSLAETLRFCISGEWPAAADDAPGRLPRETTAQMVRRRFAELPGLRTSAALLAAIDAALAPSAADRPQSVAAFRALLATAPAAEPAPEPASEPAAGIAHPPEPDDADRLSRDDGHRGRPAATSVATSAAIPPDLPETAEMKPTPAGTERRVEPAFDLGTAAAPPAAPGPDAFDQPHAAPEAARAPVTSPRQPRSSARTFWNAALLVVLLGAVVGVWGSWWWANRPVQLELGPGVAATRPAMPTPTPAPAPAPAPTPVPVPAPAPQAQAAPPAEVPAVTPSAAAQPELPTAVRTGPPPDAAPPAPPQEAASRAAPPRALAKPAPPVTAAAPARRAAERNPPGPASPRDACGDRTQFALYRCMQTQCTQPAWYAHPQCIRLRATDSVE